MLITKKFNENHEKGFTLVELLVSIAIFALVTGSSLATFIAAQKISEESRNRLYAVSAARSALEIIKNLDLGEQGLLNLENAQVVIDQMVADTNLDDRLRNGSIEMICEPDCDTLDANDLLAHVTVNVYWSPAGSSRAVECTDADWSGCKRLQSTTLRSRF